MNRNRVWIFFTTVAILIFAFPAQAADSADLIGGKFNATSHKVRGEIARKLLTTVHRLSIYVPTPKPSESAWVEQEGIVIQKLNTDNDDSTAANSRRLQYVHSPEFQQQKLYTVLADIENALSCAAAPNTPLRKEIMCWSVASFLLTDHSMFNDSIAILLKAGRLPKDVTEHKSDVMLGSESLGFGFWYEAYGRGIQEYIVIPYLKGQLK